jgi:tellurite resistance protein TerC
MLALVPIQWWHWVSFVLVILFFLALDLGVFHRRAHVVPFKEALFWTLVCFGMAMVFALTLIPVRGRDQAEDFLQGYLIELSLSMDNVFVMAMIFCYFAVPARYQHRVLFWGVLGALIARGLMIWLGTELVRTYHWTFYLFGIFLVLTALKMLLREDEEVHPDKNPVVRWVRRMCPVTEDYDGQKLFQWRGGRLFLTPLALVLVLVESMDIVFALDSIPAVFGVTQDRFIIFTSNVFAILGLRSLYFVLANALAYFQYLKFGLAAVLIFIGFKMLIVDWIKVPSAWSLAVVAGIILGAIGVSVFAARRQQGRPPATGTATPSAQPGTAA